MNLLENKSLGNLKDVKIKKSDCFLADFNYDEETDIMKNDDQDDLRAEAQEEEDELIFSKPATPKKAAEMIHSLENKEVKSLYILEEIFH